ncbi:transcriptional repressor NrdR [archaeon]|nr:MAG: transcriptional repressor NrdR [archaeon]
MNCPYCRSSDLAVVDSRETEDSVRRRRECKGCEKRFTTYERVEMAPVVIIKKDGRREQFDRSKLVKGITIACGKRPISQEKIEQVVDKIESQVKDLNKEEIKSKIIGDMAMEQLKELDNVAYIRFASVYKPNQFRDIEDIEKELRQLKKG